MELEYLERSIGKTGMLAMRPFLHIERKDLWQIPVASASQMNGLAVGPNQTFSVTDKSGPLHLWEAGESNYGFVAGYSIELSNAEVPRELTSMIETQRAYSSNAKIIQTADQMHQQTNEMKRPRG